MESGMYYKKPHVTENKLVAASGETKINAVAAKDAHLTGTWSTATGNFNRPCILSGQAGDMAEFTFTGNFFGLESGLNDDGGKYEVYVDGSIKTTAIMQTFIITTAGLAALLSLSKTQNIPLR